MSTTRQRMQTMAQNTKRMQAKAREAAQRETPADAGARAAKRDNQAEREAPDDELNHPTIGKHKGMTRGFYRFDLLQPIHHSKAEIEIGFYDEPEGGTTGEFRIAWESLGNRGQTVAQLQVFEDGWSALGCMPDLVIELGEMGEMGCENPRPIDIHALLLRLGFKEMKPAPMSDADRAELALLVG